MRGRHRLLWRPNRRRRLSIRYGHHPRCSRRPGSRSGGRSGRFSSFTRPAEWARREGRNEARKSDEGQTGSPEAAGRARDRRPRPAGLVERVSHGQQHTQGRNLRKRERCSQPTGYRRCGTGCSLGCMRRDPDAGRCGSLMDEAITDLSLLITAFRLLSLGKGCNDGGQARAWGNVARAVHSIFKSSSAHLLSVGGATRFAHAPVASSPRRRQWQCCATR